MFIENIEKGLMPIASQCIKGSYFVFSQFNTDFEFIRDINF